MLQIHHVIGPKKLPWLNTYIKKIVVPYVRRNIGVQDQAALAIFNNFHGQMTDKAVQLLDIHHVVSACSTDTLQQ